MYKENHFWNYHEVNILKTKEHFKKEIRYRKLRLFAYPVKQLCREKCLL